MFEHVKQNSQRVLTKPVFEGALMKTRAEFRSGPRAKEPAFFLELAYDTSGNEMTPCTEPPDRALLGLSVSFRGEFSGVAMAFW